MVGDKQYWKDKYFRLLTVCILDLLIGLKGLGLQCAQKVCGIMKMDSLETMFETELE